MKQIHLDPMNTAEGFHGPLNKIRPTCRNGRTCRRRSVRAFGNFVWGIQQTLGNFYDDDSSMFVLDSAWHVGSKTFEYAVTRRTFLRAGEGGGGGWKCSWEVWRHWGLQDCELCRYSHWPCFWWSLSHCGRHWCVLFQRPMLASLSFSKGQYEKTWGSQQYGNFWQGKLLTPEKVTCITSYNILSSH